MISRGRAVYERALVDPDILIEVSDPDPDYDYYAFEDFGTYTVADVFQELTGQDINDYLGEHHPHPRLQLTWNESDESLPAICPKLTANTLPSSPSCYDWRPCHQALRSIHLTRPMSRQG